MLNGLFILNTDAYESVYQPLLNEFQSRLNLLAPPFTAQTIHDQPDALAEAEILLSGWGAPVLDETFLQKAPRLKAVFYAAGSIHYFVTQAFWSRNIPITTAAYANAIPVADYALGQILVGLKRVLHYGAQVKQLGHYPKHYDAPGAFGSTVAILSLGLIGRRVCELLKSFDVRVLAYDPYVPDAIIHKLGAVPCTLDEAFRQAHVVSLHTPLLPETRGTITGTHFASMRAGATFINTARGAVVREPEMIEVLQARPDLFAVLDVTDPEPPEPDSPLYRLENVFLTPHIASGRAASERLALGKSMLEELDRFLRGEPMRWVVHQQDMTRRA